MCTVSVVYDFGRSLPLDVWTPQRWVDFQHLLKVAYQADIEMNQPDCHDPEKAKWVSAVETKLNETE